MGAVKIFREKRSGTVIFASSVIIWFLSSFDYQGQMVETSNSLLATMGRSIAPVFKPLGWGSWEATVATITGLIAKENVVGTFGVLFGQINNVSETGKEYWPLLSNQITPIAGYSFCYLIYFARLVLRQWELFVVR